MHLYAWRSEIPLQLARARITFLPLWIAISMWNSYYHNSYKVAGYTCSHPVIKLANGLWGGHAVRSKTELLFGKVKLTPKKPLSRARRINTFYMG